MKIALLIGVNSYQNLQPLPSCLNDVNQVKEYIFKNIQECDIEDSYFTFMNKLATRIDT